MRISDWSSVVCSSDLHGEHFTLLLLAPVALAGLTYLLTRTRQGLAIRAVADNRDASLLAGIDAQGVARNVWATAGALAAIAAILTLPDRKSTRLNSSH